MRLDSDSKRQEAHFDKHINTLNNDSLSFDACLFGGEKKWIHHIFSLKESFNS